MAVRVGIVGFRGYSGAELLSLLDRHPEVEPYLLEHRSDSTERTQPKRAKSFPRLPCTPDAARQERLELVFLATPHEVSMELAPAFLSAECAVIDLSGAFRLRTPENFSRWYKDQHTQPRLLAEAVYGLPEFYRDHIPNARLVANPGCYPTAANLAIRPLVQSGILDRSAGIICDAKSGVSGAGRKPSLKTSFCEVTENFSAYSILGHRHVPEVLLHSGLDEAEFSFVAHLLPVDRGILETIYIRLRPGFDQGTLDRVYEEAYANEPFVRLYHPGQVPDLRAVQHTNFCDIGFTVDPVTGRAVIVSVIDNLVKGAAGQAVQNMNLLLGFPETLGLL